MQNSTQQLTTMANEGQRLAALLRLAVREHYGIRSEKLAEFGLQPFRGRKNQKKAPETTPTTAPHSSPAPSAPLDPSH